MCMPHAPSRPLPSREKRQNRERPHIPFDPKRMKPDPDFIDERVKPDAGRQKD